MNTLQHCASLQNSNGYSDGQCYLPGGKLLSEDEEFDEMDEDSSFLNSEGLCYLPKCSFLPEEEIVESDEDSNNNEDSSDEDINIHENENTQPKSEYVLVRREIWELLPSLKCPKCNSPSLSTVSSKTLGLFESLEIICQDCFHLHHLANSTATKNHGHKTINLLSVVAVNTSGQTFVNHREYMSAMGLNCISSSAFYKMSKIIWEKAHNVAIQSFDEVREDVITNQSDSLVLCGDGAWAHRGWTSSQGLYVVWEANLKKVFNIFAFNHDRVMTKNSKKIVVRPSTTKSSSGGMEIEGVHALLDYLSKHDLLHRVSSFVVDKDAKVSNCVASYANCGHIKFHYDPGHIKKNLHKSLLNLFGKSKSYLSFPQRISSWFMRIIKISEKAKPRMLETFDSLWKYTLCHYTQKICFFPCPCLSTIASSLITWQVENEENEIWVYGVSVCIFVLLSDTDFMLISQVCRKFYRFTLSSELRRYAYKHDDNTWLCESINKEAKFILGNPNGKNPSKKLGLKGIIDKIETRKLEYLHGYHTCMNESLNHVKMGGGGMTRKELNQWQSFDSRAMYQISHINTGKFIRASRLHLALSVPLFPLYIYHLKKEDIRNLKNKQKKSSHAYKKQKQYLQRQTTLKRKERTEAAANEKDYKKGRKKTQPLFDDEISALNSGLFICPLLGNECTHTKGFKGLKCFDNHMRKKHPDYKHNSVI
jgi:hypothetical protein